MDRTKLDVVVAVFVAGTLTLGLGAAWQTSRQAQAHSEMMGSTIAHGPQPIWYLLGSVLVAGVVAGAYWVVRDQLSTGPEHRKRTRVSGSESVPASESEPTTERESRTEPASSSSGTPSSESAGDRSRTTNANLQILDVLPEDERRILEPVVDSPGVTQIALRDRADFSKSKVSQTVSDLEKRGLLYRERQGRTYRVYPSDELEEQ